MEVSDTKLAKLAIANQIALGVSRYSQDMFYAFLGTLADVLKVVGLNFLYGFSFFREIDFFLSIFSKIPKIPKNFKK